MSNHHTAAALIPAHTGYLNALDADANPAQVVVRDGAGAALATFTLSDPAGTVNGTTGQLTLTDAGGSYTASATGQAVDAQIQDGAGTVFSVLPVIKHNAAVPGYCVLNEVDLTSGMSLILVGLTVG
ncbi:hypothetical protein [Marinobacterium litorale]|uniref:hypothetical protein n=1 Tax=Marinobacterium litorale TaxID=404770 RepID=UPI000426B062|nr:hypothetical protein [Marinobacterium litorale]